MKTKSFFVIILSVVFALLLTFFLVGVYLSDNLIEQDLERSTSIKDFIENEVNRNKIFKFSNELSTGLDGGVFERSILFSRNRKVSHQFAKESVQLIDEFYSLFNTRLITVEIEYAKPGRLVWIRSGRVGYVVSTDSESEPVVYYPVEWIVNENQWIGAFDYGD